MRRYSVETAGLFKGPFLDPLICVLPSDSLIFIIQLVPPLLDVQLPRTEGKYDSSNCEDKEIPYTWVSASGERVKSPTETV